jgi:hypothetical protein
MRLVSRLKEWIAYRRDIRRTRREYRDVRQSQVDHAPVIGRLTFATVVALAALSVPSLAASQGVAHAAAPATGFAQPYAGTPKYEKYAPTQATSARQVNRRLGLRAADRIARKLGLDKRRVFTARQYRRFVSGKGVGGDPAAAKMIDESVRIFTNTTGNPLYANVDGKLTPIVLGSYGLMVNTAGVLESLANTDAPTRQVNKFIEPGGYLPTWCRQNGARASLRMLYRSAYTSEVVYGNKSQQQSGVAQLVPNQKGLTSSIVGMSMAPSIWIVNFSLVYMLNPNVAAKMPARWTPIPANVALAIAASPAGQVPFSEYESSFPG